MRYFLGFWVLIIVAVISVLGFRGAKTTEPPIIVFPDMDEQAKFLPQGKNDFFEDGRNARPVPAGTVQRGYGFEMKNVFDTDYEYDVAKNPEYHSGKNSDGSFYAGFPVEVTQEMMELGQQQYDIFCTVCHGQSGDGNGITKQYGMVATPTYHSDRIRQMPEGEIFQTITHGKGLMGAYGGKMDVKERWAVIAYLRALQLANNASVEDVPGEFKTELGL